MIFSLGEDGKPDGEPLHSFDLDENVDYFINRWKARKHGERMVREARETVRVGGQNNSE